MKWVQTGILLELMADGYQLVADAPIRELS
jgi:hypothetical protein